VNGGESRRVLILAFMLAQIDAHIHYKFPLRTPLRDCGCCLECRTCSSTLGRNLGEGRYGQPTIHVAEPATSAKVPLPDGSARPGTARIRAADCIDSLQNVAGSQRRRSARVRHDGGAR
jgi:hypothetical protein